MLNKLKIRLHALLRKSKIESELDEESRYHIEQQTEQNIRRTLYRLKNSYISLLLRMIIILTGL
jgi:hypothetical protein